MQPVKNIEKRNNTLIPILAPVLLVVLAAVLAYIFIGYRPFNTLRSQQLLAYAGTNATDANIENSSAAAQSAINLNPDNCTAYGLLGDIYGDKALRLSGSMDKPNISLLKMEINVGEEGIKHCPISRSSLDMEYDLARDYSMLGNHEKSAFYLQQLIKADPINVNDSLLDMGDLYVNLGNENQALGNDADAFSAFLSGANYQADEGPSGGAVSGINGYLKNDPKLMAQLMPGQPIGFGRYASASITPEGKFLLLAHAKVNPNILLYTTSLDGSTFQAQGVLMINGYPVGGVAQDGQNITHFVYSASGKTIVYMNSEDSLDKSIIVDITKTIPPVTYPKGLTVSLDSSQVAVSPNGTVHVIYTLDNSQLGYLTIDHGKPSTPVLLTNDAEFPDIKAASNGNVYAIYSNAISFPSPQSRLWFIEEANGKWSTPVQIGVRGMWSGAASMSLQPDGRVDVVFVSGTSPSTTKLMFVRKDQTGKWSQPEVIGENGYRPWIPSGTISFGGRTAPSIVFANNKLVVIWRVPGNPTRVAGIVQQNNVWGNPRILGSIEGGDYHDSPSIVVSTQKSAPSIVYLLWPEAGNPIFHKWIP